MGTSPLRARASPEVSRAPVEVDRLPQRIDRCDLIVGKVVGVGLPLEQLGALAPGHRICESQRARVLCSGLPKRARRMRLFGGRGRVAEYSLLVCCGLGVVREPRDVARTAGLRAPRGIAYAARGVGWG